MRTLVRLLALLLTLIVVFLLPLSLFGFQVGQTLFSPVALLNLVATEVVGTGTADDIVQASLRALPGSLGIAEDSPVTSALQAAVTQSQLVELLLPPSLQVEYAAQFINVFFNWYHGPDAQPVWLVDLRPLENNLTQNSPQLAARFFELLPVCTPEQSAGLAVTALGALLSGEITLETLLPCVPPLVPLELVVTATGDLLQSQFALLPDTLLLQDSLPVAPGRLLEYKRRLHLLEGVLAWSWLPLSFLLLIAAVVGGQTRDGVPRWLGWSLLVSGLLAILLTFVPVGWWMAPLRGWLEAWPAFIELPALAVFAGIFWQAGASLLWLGVGQLVLAIVFLLLAFLLRPRAKQQNAA